MNTSTWHADRLSGYGSYTSWQVGYDPWDYFAFFGDLNATNDYIQAPCEHNGCNGDPDDKSTEWILHLSGSASCLQYWEFINGAWLAGWSSSNRVLESLGYQLDWYDPCSGGLIGTDLSDYVIPFSTESPSSNIPDNGNKLSASNINGGKGAKVAGIAGGTVGGLILIAGGLVGFFYYIHHHRKRTVVVIKDFLKSTAGKDIIESTALMVISSPKEGQISFEVMVKE